MSFQKFRGTLRSVIRRYISPDAETRLHTAYHSLLRRVGAFGIPEPRETQKLLKYLSENSSTIFDVGANVGRYTRFFAINGSPDANIFAFEPSPNAFKILRRNTSSLSNVYIFEIALGTTNQRVNLNIPVDGFGNPVTALGWTSTDTSVDLQHSAQVPGRSLDGLVRDRSINLREPVLLKIDVEGSELEVLKGSLEIISNTPSAIYFECESPHLARKGIDAAAIWSLLQGAGYSILSEKDGTFRCCDVITDLAVNYLALPAKYLTSRSDAYSADQLGQIWSSKLVHR